MFGCILLALTRLSINWVKVMISNDTISLKIIGQLACAKNTPRCKSAQHYLSLFFIILKQYRQVGVCRIYTQVSFWAYANWPYDAISMQQNKILFRTQWKIRRIRIEADDAYGVCSCLTAESHHETIKSAE